MCKKQYQESMSWLRKDAFPINVKEANGFLEVLNSIELLLHKVIIKHCDLHM